MDLSKRLADLEAEMIYLKAAITEANCKNTEIKSEQTEFKEGDWAVADGSMFCITETGYKRQYPNDTCFVGYGFFKDGSWRSEQDGLGLLYVTDNKVERKATPEEVKESLVKEGERRGYKLGNFECLKSGFTWKDSALEGWDYLPNQDSLWLGAGEVYYKGEWAEIVEDKLTIGGYEVTEVTVEHTVKIGCKYLDKNNLRFFIETINKVGLSEFKKAVADLDETKLKQLEELL